MSFLAVCLVLLTLYIISPTSASKCTRSQPDKKKLPQFFCAYDVTIRRRSNCTLLVTERFLFPHTVAGRFNRTIEKLSDQEIDDVTLHREGQPSDYEDDHSNAESVHLSISTSNSSVPVLYSLSYIFRNGVMRFKDDCGNDKLTNIIHWFSGHYPSITFDHLSVNISTENNDATLTTLSEEGDVVTETKTQLIFESTNVSKSFRLYVSELGEPLCSVKTPCIFDDEKPPRIRFVKVLSFAVIVLFFIGLFCLCLNQGHCRDQVVQ